MKTVSTLECNASNISVVVSEVISEIDLASELFLKRYGIFEMVLGYMCEAYMQGPEVSVAEAVLYCTGALARIPEQPETALWLTPKQIAKNAALVKSYLNQEDLDDPIRHGDVLAS